MKQFLFLILMCLGVISTQAQQKPQYYFAPKLDDSAHFGITYNFNIYSAYFVQYNGSNYSQLYKSFSIYYPRNFNYPPKGRITALYLWVHNAQTGSTDGKYRFSNVTIKMGNTSRDSFGVGPSCKLFDEEKELTKVIFGNPYILPDTTLAPYYNFRKWIKLPLQVPIMFDPNKNLVVRFENSYDSSAQQPTLQTNIFGFTCRDSQSLNKVRIVDVRLDSTFANVPLYNKVFFSSLPCIGFDLDTTGVSEVKEAINTQLSLYPNPAKATIHFSLKGSYTITTLQGAIVQQGEGDVANIRALPQGLYLVQLTTKNGERLVDRFLKE